MIFSALFTFSLLSLSIHCLSSLSRANLTFFVCFAIFLPLHERRQSCKRLPCSRFSWWGRMLLPTHGSKNKTLMYKFRCQSTLHIWQKPDVTRETSFLISPRPVSGFPRSYIPPRAVRRCRAYLSFIFIPRRHERPTTYRNCRSHRRFRCHRDQMTTICT